MLLTMHTVLPHQCVVSLGDDTDSPLNDWFGSGMLGSTLLYLTGLAPPCWDLLSSI